MEVLWIFSAIVAFYIIVWAIDVCRNRHPLNTVEVFALSRKRQRNRALGKFDFSRKEQPADPAKKKTMKAQGEFVICDLTYWDAPAHIASLLKYKKHEWIVIAFINSSRVQRIWWNKGPDGTKVWSLLRNHSLNAAIRSFKPDAIAILHNHPNPDPSRLRTNVPSEADLRSADLYGAEFSKHGTSLLEFICERGVPHLYYARFSDALVPIRPIADEIQKVNGTGIFKNYSLRKELKQPTEAERVAGGGVGQVDVKPV